MWVGLSDYFAMTGTGIISWPATAWETDNQSCMPASGDAHEMCKVRADRDRIQETETLLFYLSDFF
jgi:hypothetical protein